MGYLPLKSMFSSVWGIYLDGAYGVFASKINVFISMGYLPRNTHIWPGTPLCHTTRVDVNAEVTDGANRQHSDRVDQDRHSWNLVLAMNRRDPEHFGLRDVQLKPIGSHPQRDITDALR